MMHLFRDTRFIHQLWFACISVYLFATPFIELVALFLVYDMRKKFSAVYDDGRDDADLEAYRIIVTIDGFVVLDCSLHHLAHHANINPVMLDCKNVKIQVIPK